MILLSAKDFRTLASGGSVTVELATEDGYVHQSSLMLEDVSPFDAMMAACKGLKDSTRGKDDDEA